MWDNLAVKSDPDTLDWDRGHFPFRCGGKRLRAVHTEKYDDEISGIRNILIVATTTTAAKSFLGPLDGG